MRILKSFKQYLIRNLITKNLLKLQFVNYGNPYICGQKDRIKLGCGVSLMNTVINTNSGTVSIGNGVIFGHNCMVLTGRHNYESHDIYKMEEHPLSGSNIEIGEGTWVCSGAIIIGNVKIGKYCVVAAGSVVTKDIPDNSFVAGVPARIIKEI